MSVTRRRNVRKAVAFGMAKRLSGILDKGHVPAGLRGDGQRVERPDSAELRVIDIEVGK